MTLKTKEKIIKVANYIIENKATKKQTQEKFNLSRSTIKKYINDDDKLKSIDYDLYLKVKKVQDEIIDYSNEKGGQVSLRINIDEEEEMKLIIDSLLKKKMTVHDVSITYGIPLTILYEKLYSLNNEKINKYLKKINY